MRSARARINASILSLSMQDLFKFRTIQSKGNTKSLKAYRSLVRALNAMLKQHITFEISSDKSKACVRVQRAYALW